MFVYFLLLSVFMSAVGGIFNAALYRYACFKQVPRAFSQELIASAWAPKAWRRGPNARGLTLTWRALRFVAAPPVLAIVAGRVCNEF